jgi:hypothetical protein
MGGTDREGGREGRVRLRPNRGFPDHLALRRDLMNIRSIGPPIDRG